MLDHDKLDVIARGEATECEAILDVVRLLAIEMLTKLCR